MKPIKCMSENEKIVATIKELGAKDFESAVTMEQIIEKGIQLGFTEDYNTECWNGYKEGDHPWWTVVAPMMGIGTDMSVKENEELHLHRQKVVKEGGSRKSNVMVYWFDPKSKHALVKRSNKASGKVIKMAAATSFSEVKTLSDDEKMQLAENNSDKYRYINHKLISESWIQQNPEKFKALYGNA